MRIIIAGVGNIGSGLGLRLLQEGHDLIFIDHVQEQIEKSQASNDALTILGNCASMKTLRDAGVEQSDVLIAVTNSDEKNLLCCMTAHNMNPEIKTIARIKTSEYAETSEMFFENFGLSMTMEPELYAAKDVEALLTYPGLIHRERFAKGMTDVISLDLPSDHPLCGHEISEFSDIIGVHALVCAVIRDEKAQTPGPNFKLKAGDRIYITTSTENFSYILKKFGGKSNKIRRIFIVGGGETAFKLLSRIRHRSYSITVVEENLAACQRLAEYFPSVNVIHGNGNNISLLDDLDIEENDALICLTSDDEINTILGVYGNMLQIPSVIIQLKHMDYGKIFDKKAKGTVINPRRLTGDMVVQYLRSLEDRNTAAISVHSIAGDTQIAEFLVGFGCKHCGEPLKNIKFKKNVILASINRNGRNIVPGPDTIFMAGDTVLAAFSRDDVIGFNDLFV